jgi:hypothetical protein
MIAFEGRIGEDDWIVEEDKNLSEQGHGDEVSVGNMDAFSAENV